MKRLKNENVLWSWIFRFGFDFWNKKTMNFSKSSETIIFDDLLQKLNESLDSFNFAKASRILPSKMRKIEKLWKITLWTSKFSFIAWLIVNFKAGGHLFMDLFWVLDRLLSRQRMKMVRNLYVPLQEITKKYYRKICKIFKFLMACYNLDVFESKFGLWVKFSFLNYITCKRIDVKGQLVCRNKLRYLYTKLN